MYAHNIHNHVVFKYLNSHLCANIFLPPTFKTTSHNSRCLLRTFSSASVTRGCFSDVCDNRAGDGGRSPSIASPILLAAKRSGAEAQPHTVSIYNIEFRKLIWFLLLN